MSEWIVRDRVALLTLQLEMAVNHLALLPVYWNNDIINLIIIFILFILCDDMFGLHTLHFAVMYLLERRLYLALLQRGIGHTVREY